ncbi:MAG: hybrid non-ribosomal peptide synthase/polyketide synthase, partial [Rhodocyclales bacterium]|nr:hybrid non-ribosomal peptide synthase/polyketide synthase [Rhodocyclales bacterium]
RPDAPAVHTPERTLSYGTLLREACAVANWLQEHGAERDTPVAIVMRKGWEQIVAVFGTLLAGAYYLPIDANLPGRRQQELLATAGVRHVLTHDNALKPEAAGDTRAVHEILAGRATELSAAHMLSLAGPLDDIAYVIFTSGTTGIPKGVMIDHRGASNTIVALNSMIGVGPGDAVLGVSSLSFDLSVYDIFGLLSAGGSVVLPDPRAGHDPAHWRELMTRFGVTLWNSAPQLMRMLTDSADADTPRDERLRQVLLSGDFIPLDLPERIRSQHPHAQVISLGGATEASIWSNYYPIDRVAAEWTSIPYGKALPNQTIQVLDCALRPTPDHVRGRIYIGGVGLAHGYLGDAEKTASRFFTHPRSGERLYDTGDLGRYMQDGNIVILGRDDGQVKIRGHRVELGEIETLLRQANGIKQALVTVRAAANDGKQLVAYVLGETSPEQVDADALGAFLAERLPDYMVPRHIIALQSWPVSANGKIDYKALPDVHEDADAESQRVMPRNAIEQSIFAVWSRVIVGLDIGVTDNFFELGGDSVLATQLVRELNIAMPSRIEMHELFENLTIEMLAALYQSRAQDEDSGEHMAGEMVGDFTQDATPIQMSAHTALLSDAQIASELAEQLARLDALPIAARQDISKNDGVLLTGATGWVGAHVLMALLDQGKKVTCIVRAADAASAHLRLLQQLEDLHLMPSDPTALQQLNVLCGDLEKPGFGLDATDWHALCYDISAIYHFAASVNVLHDYATLRRTNVTPLLPLLQLASTQRAKHFVTLSPIAVCRRHIDGQLRVMPDESVSTDAAGLLTAYAQTKWVAERMLAQMASQGLTVRIYRCSHALPAMASGVAKSEDTYTRILTLARNAGVVPDWDEALLRGVPVDTLSRLIVEDAHMGNDTQLVVHIENQSPMSLPEIVHLLIGKDSEQVPRISLESWKARCLDLADTLPAAQSSLSRVLFAQRANGTAVENMFTAHDIATDYF